MSTARVMRSSAVMATGTAASRLLGFVKAVILLTALPFGASADSFSVANTVPNAIYILLAGGVLNALLVPQITRAARQLDGGKEYIDRLLTLSITLLFGITVVVTLAAPLLINLYATDKWSPQQHSLAIAFALWCLPQVFWYGLYTLLGQVLNARDSFGPFMWAPVINNLVSMAGIVAFIAVYGTDRKVNEWSTGSIALLSGTATLGVVAQALFLVPFLRRMGIGFRPRWGLRGFGLRTAGRVAGWTFAAVLIQQVGFVVVSRVTTAGGALLKDGTHGNTGKVVYDNAFLLFMLPHSLVAVSLVTALFTRMSVAAAANDLDEVRADLSLGVRITGVATVLATTAFLALGPDLCRAMFPSLSTAGADQLSWVTRAMMLGLVPFSATYLFQRVFYAFEDAKTPFLIQVPIVLVNIVGNVLALELLPARWVVAGVGLAMSVAGLVGGLIAIVALNRRLEHIDGPRVLRTHVRLLLAAIASGGLAWGCAAGLHGLLADSWSTSLVVSAVGGVVLVVGYVAALRLLKVQELEEALLPLIRRARPEPRHVQV